MRLLITLWKTSKFVLILQIMFLFQFVLKPIFTKAMISKLDKQSKMSRAYDDAAYFPGIIGLNNIKANDYCNVVLEVKYYPIKLLTYCTSLTIIDLYRRFLMLFHFVTISCKKKTT